MGNGRIARFYPWADVIRAYTLATSGEWEPTGQLAELARSWADADDGSFYGANSETVRDWLRNGYTVPRLPDHVPLPYADLSHKPRWRRNDDPAGEFQYDEFANGETDYYAKRDGRISKAGINVEIGITFVCSTKAKVVAAYSEWCGAAITAIRAQGFDVAISFVTRVESLVPGEDRNDVHIIVNSFGEVNLAQDYSVMFSPAGYRHLMFAACTLSDETESVGRVDSGLGRCISTDWDVSWNAATRTLSFDTNQMGSTREFPAHDMTVKLAEIQASL